MKPDLRISSKDYSRAKNLKVRLARIDPGRWSTPTGTVFHIQRPVLLGQCLGSDWL
ncbi:MAG: hypothetical protein AAB380_01750 [Verrucomicrobiota bacterium]